LTELRVEVDVRALDHVDTRAARPARDLTYADVAAAIGEAIGQHDLQYVQLPDEELVAILIQTAGFSPNFSALFVEFNQALSEGRLHSLEGRNETNTTQTEFEEFAAELAHAYAAAA
jgi:hypothetical protein